MAATSLLARLGLRIATLGSAASLALAAPAAEGNVDQDNHTRVGRTGIYFPTSESIGVVVNGSERMRLWGNGGVQIGGPYDTDVEAGRLRIVSGNVATVPVNSFLQRPLLVLADNNNNHAGIQISNISSGNAADSRLTLNANDGSSYFTMNLPSTGSTETLFGLQRNTLVGLFHHRISGATRCLAIGTVTTGCILFGTNSIVRMRIFEEGGVQIGGVFDSTPGVAVLRVSANTSATLQANTTGSRIIATGADGENSIVLAESYGAALGTGFIGRAARGTNATPTAVQTDDVLAIFGGRGYGATAFSSLSRASIRASARQTWTDSAQAACISVFVTPTNTATAIEAARFQENGALQIGGTLTTVQNPGSVNAYITSTQTLGNNAALYGDAVVTAHGGLYSVSGSRGRVLATISGSTGTGAQFYGSIGIAEMTDANANTGTALLSGHVGSATATISGTTGTVLTEISGGLATVGVYNVAGSGSVTVPDIYGYRIASMTVGTANVGVTTTVTRAYGLYIPDFTISGSGTVVLTNRYGLYQAGSANINRFEGSVHARWFRVTTTALTDAATINTDASTSNIFSVTLAGNRTLANPTNLSPGTTYIWRITQDGVGGRTLAFGNAFKWVNATVPTIAAGANQVSIITGLSDGTNIYCVMGANFA